MSLPEIEISELLERMAGGVEVLDVRKVEEYSVARIPGVIHIPLAEIPLRYTELNSSEEICVVCGKGGRSAKAVEFLLSKGYKAVNVSGGTEAWIEAGNPYDAG